MRRAIFRPRPSWWYVAAVCFLLLFAQVEPIAADHWGEAVVGWVLIGVAALGLVARARCRGGA